MLLTVVIPVAPLPIAATSLLCVGADWFTETRTVTAVSATGVQFAQGRAMGANNRVFLQGDKTLISEAGEWALEHATGLLYYWPRDQAAMGDGSSHILAASTPRVLDIRGEGWSQSELATAIDIDGRHGSIAQN